MLPIVGHGPADMLCMSASGASRPRAMGLVVVSWFWPGDVAPRVKFIGVFFPECIVAT